MAQIQTSPEAVNTNLKEAFGNVLKWLQLDVDLSQVELAKLQSSFDAAANGQSAFMIASSRSQTVVISERTAVCVEGANDKAGLLARYRGKASARDSINRDGFFLFAERNDKDPAKQESRKWTMDILFGSAPDDRKMNLG